MKDLKQIDDLENTEIATVSPMMMMIEAKKAGFSMSMISAKYPRSIKAKSRCIGRSLTI